MKTKEEIQKRIEKIPVRLTERILKRRTAGFFPGNKKKIQLIIKKNGLPKELSKPL